MDQPSEVTGRCHICKTHQIIRWCGLCKHWFCGECKVKYFHRGLEAVKELLNGSYPGCCGPEKVNG